MREEVVSREWREKRSGEFLAGEDVGPTKGTSGVVVLQPLLQTGRVEEVPAGETAHHRLRLEPAEANPAVGWPPALPRGPEPKWPAPLPEALGEAGLRRAPGGHLRGRLRAEAEEMECRAEELLQDGEG